ncbi:hypothetical protein [Streptomyces sp. NPDC088923]|uniref:hypothetical protein n=1 Tax=Streptomyces sp. NPDC088923 TaxID=3365913 RepID=UPI00382C60D7
MIEYQLSATDLPVPGYATETRGGVRFVLNRGLFLPDEVAALNTLAAGVIRPRTWFQLWQGETVPLGLGPVPVPPLDRVPTR